MRALLVFLCLIAASTQTVMASDPPNPLSAEERARMRIVDVKAFFLANDVPRSLAPMAQRVKRTLRRKFNVKADDSQPGVSARADNIQRVRLVAHLAGYVLIEGGSVSSLRGYVLVQDVESGAMLARYGRISASQRFVGSRNTRIYLAREFADEAFKLFNGKSDRTGIRTVEEMATAYIARSAAHR